MPNQMPKGADRQLGLHAIVEVNDFVAHGDARGKAHLDAHPEDVPQAEAWKVRLSHLGEAMLSSEVSLGEA